MTEKSDQHKHQSAPELPAEIARKFGLHHDTETPLEHASESPRDNLADPKTDAAVDDILRKESDALLEGQMPVPTPPQPKRGFWRKVGGFFKAWWRNKWARWITILLLLALIAAGAIIQDVRHAALNTIGVRSKASVVVLDETTRLPLKNVAVTLGNYKAMTDIKGEARFENLKLGDYSLEIERIAFASYKRKITIGWGSNPLGDIKLKATGIQYSLVITDYLSGKSLPGAEVVTDDVNALADKSGKVILTVESTDETTLPVTVQLPGYRSEAIELNPTVQTPTQVVLVPNQKSVFVSKQSGKYDVFASDLDGKNRKLLLAGTGTETSNLALVVSPDGKRAAYVASRDNKRDEDGYLLQALTIIDLEEGASSVADHAEQIQLVDWIGNRLIYRATIAGASAANPQRNRLISLNYQTNSKSQLATANQFNAIISAKGLLYYGVSSTDPDASMGLYRVKPDGSSRKRLTEDEIWTGIRTTYNTLSLQTPDGWFAYNLKNEELNKTNAPGELGAYAFVDDSKAKRSLWVDVRDGKGVLLSYDIDKDAHQTLVTQEGLGYPVRWAGDKAIIYRVAMKGEIADYVVSSEGGTARKITDVSPAYGFAQVY
jgi:hypothetical protein